MKVADARPPMASTKAASYPDLAPLAAGLQVRGSQASVALPCFEVIRSVNSALELLKTPFMIDSLHNDQGWDAFGSPVSASSASTNSPAEVDGLTKNQVDALFEEADGNRDGRYASNEYMHSFQLMHGSCCEAAAL